MMRPTRTQMLEDVLHVFLWIFVGFCIFSSGALLRNWGVMWNEK